MNRVPHDWMIEGLETSARIVALMLDGLSQEQAQKIRDGADGWNIVDIMCHLRDYQNIFFGRVTQLLEEDKPTFHSYDEAARLALTVDNDYANQELRNVHDDYAAARAQLINCLTELDEEQWRRLAHFPGIGDVDLSFLIFHTILHDGEHIEQLATLLRQ